MPMETLYLMHVAAIFSQISEIRQALAVWRDDTLRDLSFTVDTDTISDLARQNRAGKTSWRVVVIPEFTYSDMQRMRHLDLPASGPLSKLVRARPTSRLALVDFNLTNRNEYWGYQQRELTNKGQKRATDRAVICGLIANPKLLTGADRHWGTDDDQGSQNRITIGVQNGRVLLGFSEVNSGKSYLGVFREAHI